MEDKITALSMAINRQIEDLADARKRQTLNVYITTEGEIREIEDARLLAAKVEDCEKVLDDMLRSLDKLIAERDEE